MNRSSDGPGVTVLATRDFERAHAYIDRVFTPHRLSLHGTSTLGFDLRYAESAVTTVGYMTYGVPVTVDVPPPGDCYHLILPIRGTCAAAQRRERAEAVAGQGAAMLSPDEPVKVDWAADSVAYVVKVPRVCMETHLARLTGQAGQRVAHFPLSAQLRAGSGEALAATIRFLLSELDRPGGISTMPLAREQLEYAVLTQLLMVVPHDCSKLLTREGWPASRRRLQQVVDLIHEHPEQPLTTGHLAAAAGITERALQLAFHKQIGTSPAAYVREVRLDRVYADLCSGTNGATVTEVAAHWGFLHPSRFAQQYRQRFGVLPSITAARARRDQIRESAAPASVSG